MRMTLRAYAHALILLLAASSLASADEQAIHLRLGAASIFNVRTSFETIMIGDSGVVDVHAHGDRSVIIEPLKIGAANVIFIDERNVVVANVRIFVCGVIRTKYREGLDCE